MAQGLPPPTFFENAFKYDVVDDKGELYDIDPLTIYNPGFEIIDIKAGSEDAEYSVSTDDIPENVIYDKTLPTETELKKVKSPFLVVRGSLDDKLLEVKVLANGDKSWFLNYNHLEKHIRSQEKHMERLVQHLTIGSPDAHVTIEDGTLLGSGLADAKVTVYYNGRTYTFEGLNTAPSDAIFEGSTLIYLDDPSVRIVEGGIKDYLGKKLIPHVYIPNALEVYLENCSVIGNIGAGVTNKNPL